MDRHSTENYVDFGSGSRPGTPKRTVAGLFHSASALVATYSKEAGRVSRKWCTKMSHSANSSKSALARPKRLLTNISNKARPKRLLTDISNKARPFLHKKKGGEESDEGAEDGFGDGGVWQRAILMGDKCQPLDFSGVIYYDSKGEILQELPHRSPRASPLPDYAYRK